MTNYAQLGSGTTELIEMDEKGTGGCRYHLEQIDKNETMLKIDLLVKNHPIVLLFFNLTMKISNKKAH